jgi:hypothetical protein
MLKRKLIVLQGAVDGCNPGTVAKAKEELLMRLRVLDTVLLSRTFLVGERLTLADAALCLTLLPAFSLVLGKYLQDHEIMVLLHNGGFCNNCTPKRCFLHFQTNPIYNTHGYMKKS